MGAKYWSLAVELRAELIEAAEAAMPVSAAV
jgi:hypothetical protein